MEAAKVLHEYSTSYAVNGTTTCSSSHYDEERSVSKFPQDVLIFHYIKIPYCSLIVVLNTLLIGALLKFKLLRQYRHYFSLNLAVADWTMGVEGMLHSITFFNHVTPTHFLGHTVTFLLKCTVYASVLTFLVIAVVEFNAVNDPFNCGLTKFKCYLLISLIWTVSATLGAVSTYVKATDTETYIHVKEFELTFYLASTCIICLIYVLIFSFIQTRKRRFQFYEPSMSSSEGGRRSFKASIWATNPTNVQCKFDVYVQQSRKSSSRSMFYSHSAVSTPTSSIENVKQTSIIEARRSGRLRVNTGQHFYNTNKAAATAAVITLTFMACFVPYIAIYAKNIKQLTNDTSDSILVKSYVNGIIFSARSLLNPIIQVFRSRELRRHISLRYGMLKRKFSDFG